MGRGDVQSGGFSGEVIGEGIWAGDGGVVGVYAVRYFGLHLPRSAIEA